MYEDHKLWPSIVLLQINSRQVSVTSSYQNSARTSLDRISIAVSSIEIHYVIKFLLLIFLKFWGSANEGRNSFVARVPPSNFTCSLIPISTGYLSILKGK